LHLVGYIIPDAVDTAVCACDDGWWYHPKHVEQFPDKINCVTLHLVEYISEYSYDTRIHERYILSQPVHRRSLTESDDTRCCINTI